uniref:40S ribosomal protein S26 n=1 Tax=Triticum urartu TaxID=4572 RepID=A0A8R7PWA8_TRIUA
MTFKRRNGGRNKHGRGHVRFIRYDNCGKCVPKDKAIKRYKVQNIVAPEGISYFTEASVLDGYHLPKIYLKERWCMAAPSIRRSSVSAPVRTARTAHLRKTSAAGGQDLRAKLLVLVVSAAVLVVSAGVLVASAVVSAPMVLAVASAPVL